jgi:hypothetical protein
MNVRKMKELTEYGDTDNDWYRLIESDMNCELRFRVKYLFLTDVLVLRGSSWFSAFCICENKVNFK